MDQAWPCVAHGGVIESLFLKGTFPRWPCPGPRPDTVDHQADERNFHLLRYGEVIRAYTWFNSNLMLTKTACLWPIKHIVCFNYFLLLFFYLFIYLFIFGCVGSSFLCGGFLQLRRSGATLHRGARASHCRGLSRCGAQAPDAQAH